MLNIIDNLPRDSAYGEAMANDETLAEYLAGMPQPKVKPSRRVSDWSAEVELLTAILDRLGEAVQAIAAIGGAKPKQVRPAPRPVTAIDRVRRRRAEQKHRSIVTRVLPGSNA